MYSHGAILVPVKLPKSPAGPFTKETPTANKRNPVKNVMNFRIPLPMYLSHDIRKAHAIVPYGEHSGKVIVYSTHENTTDYDP